MKLAINVAAEPIISGIREANPLTKLTIKSTAAFTISGILATIA